MTTKKLLLTAAALLAAGIVSSRADSPVYSQNVVGYASVALSGSSTYAMTIPFNIGVSNGANEIWPAASGTFGQVGVVPTLPDYSEILVWTGTGFNQYYSDSSSASGWDDLNLNPLTFSPKLPVGQAFFMIPSTSVTTTFAGTVAVAVGTSSPMALAGSTTYFVAPSVPYSGAVTNGNSTAGGANLWSPDGVAGLPDYSEILIWTGTGFAQYYSDHTSPSLWDDLNLNPLLVPPSINVGQGFFLIPSTAFTWHVGLTGQ